MYRLLFFLLLLASSCKAQPSQQYYSVSGKLYYMLREQRVENPVQVSLYSIQGVPMLRIKGVVSQSLPLSLYETETRGEEVIKSYRSKDGQGHVLDIALFYSREQLSQVAITHEGKGWLMYIIPEMQL